MSKCRFLTPCGICEIKSMSGIPYMCDLMRIGKLEEECEIPIPEKKAEPVVSGTAVVQKKTGTKVC